MFKQAPVCEVCGLNEAAAIVFLQNPLGAWTGVWKFACGCTSQEEGYYIEIHRIFSSPPATVDWLAHMRKKDWVDWNDFMSMMRRFRVATNSFGILQ